MNDFMRKRSAALITGPDTHLDHLGVLSAVLKIPLIVTEEKTFQLAQSFYPQANVWLKEPSELSIDFLAENFDLLLESGKFWAVDLIPMIELLFKKKIRLLFCPHGNSDKGHSLKTHVKQDIALFYGQHMLDLLKSNGAYEQIGQLIRTGNYRLPFYRAHKSFYDSLAEKLVFSHLDPNKKTILYAPTWQDRENPSSFFSACENLILQLHRSFNIIVKLHPFLEEDHPAQVLHVISKYETQEGVLFLKDFPSIYPLIARADLYLGDFSSIGYDFLAFDKPLFFLSQRSKDAPGGTLHRCGMEIPLEEQNNLLQFLETHYEITLRNFSRSRKEIYNYAFGEEKAPDKVWQEIAEALNLRFS